MPHDHLVPLCPLLFTGLLALGPGCSEPEPVLSGVPDRALLGEGAAGELAAEGEEPGYVQPKGTYIDVRHLGGRSFDGSRDIIGSQLGTLLESTSLGGENGRELVFERATLRVVDDLVYMVRVPLPEPLRRSDALELLGFPTQTDDAIVLHREYRLNHEWGFRRIRMMRLSTANELVHTVEAWRWVPGERSSRR